MKNKKESKFKNENILFIILIYMLILTLILILHVIFIFILLMIVIFILTFFINLLISLSFLPFLYSNSHSYKNTLKFILIFYSNFLLLFSFLSSILHFFILILIFSITPFRPISGWIQSNRRARTKREILEGTSK